MNLATFLWPEICLRCSTPGATICARCRQTGLVKMPADLCHVCGVAAYKYKVHIGCRELTSLDGVFPAYVYNDLLAKALVEVKYSFKHQLLRRLMVGVELHLPPVDMVMPVPLAARRRRWRGFNQAALLAHLVCQASGLPLETECLLRTVFKHSQVGTGRSQRLQSLYGAFSVNPSCDIRKKSVLLVDDVMTTGSTLEACAAVLRRAGAGSVYAFVLGRDLVSVSADTTP